MPYLRWELATYGRFGTVTPYRSSSRTAMNGTRSRPPGCRRATVSAAMNISAANRLSSGRARSIRLGSASRYTVPPLLMMSVMSNPPGWSGVGGVGAGGGGGVGGGAFGERGGGGVVGVPHPVQEVVDAAVSEGGGVQP